MAGPEARSDEAIEAAVKVIRDLYDEMGNEDYIGEKVSQIEHALQCGDCAVHAGAEDAVVIGAMLHGMV
jgi:predicted HD phosphohydrolase